MEAASVAGLKAELKGLEHRVDAMHSGLGSVRAGIGRSEVEQGVIKTELTNVRDDLKELNGKMTWILRGLFGAIAIGLTFIVGVAMLIVQVS